jgi:hypothetical protein
MFENRHYIIFNSSDIHLVNFNEVLETSPDTCRFSVDGSKTFVKFEGGIPGSVEAIEGRSMEYSHSEILDILSGPEWTSEDELV